VGSLRTATRFTPGAISLSKSSHFPLRLYSYDVKTGGVAAGPRQAIDEAGHPRDPQPPRTRPGTVRVARNIWPTVEAPLVRMTSGASAASSAAEARCAVGRHRRCIGEVSERCGRPNPIPAAIAGTPRAGRDPPESLSAKPSNTPMRRRSACCASAASGHARVEPRKNLVKSRRRILTPNWKCWQPNTLRSARQRKPSEGGFSISGSIVVGPAAQFSDAAATCRIEPSRAGASAAFCDSHTVPYFLRRS